MISEVLSSLHSLWFTLSLSLCLSLLPSLSPSFPFFYKSPRQLSLAISGVMNPSRFLEKEPYQQNMLLISGGSVATDSSLRIGLGG
jgi:hypothetical protein